MKATLPIWCISSTLVLLTACAREFYFYKLASDDLVREMFATTTTPISYVRDIPPYVMKAVREVTRDDFRIADRGRPYIATDVVLLPEMRGLPNRQLQVATRSEKYVLLAYHVGGYGQGFCVLAFSITPNEHEAHPILIATLTDFRVPHDTVSDIAQAFEHGKLQQYRPTSLDF